MTQLLAHLFGDFVFQSDYLAQNKAKRSWPCFVHCLLYSLCFLPLCWVSAWTEPSFTAVHPLSRSTILWPALYHHADIRWLPWLVIFSTHFLIDRFRLARYVVWAKNFIGPWSRMETVGEAAMRMKAAGELSSPIAMPGELRGIKVQRIRLVSPLSECPTGYPPSTPIWMATWLTIICDNTLHLTINYLALRYL
jgi:hypothetical protein